MERDRYVADRGIETMRVDAREVERDCAAVVALINRRCIERTGGVPPTHQRSPGLISWLLQRTELVRRPALAPKHFDRGLRKVAFVCSRCRKERPGCERSTTRTSCCVFCEV